MSALDKFILSSLSQGLPIADIEHGIAQRFSPVEERGVDWGAWEIVRRLQQGAR